MLLENAASNRKLFSLLCALSMLFISIPIINATPRNGDVNTEVFVDQDGTFNKVWVEHSVMNDGKKGMRIHANFTIKNNLNVQCRFVARFYKQDGTPLRAGDDSGYRAGGGDLGVLDEFKPHYNQAEYGDVSLFLPYRELRITEPGIHPLKFVLFLERETHGWQVIAKSEDHNFKYRKS